MMTYYLQYLLNLYATYNKKIHNIYIKIYLALHRLCLHNLNHIRIEREILPVGT